MDKLDFVEIRVTHPKKDTCLVSPEFIVSDSEDLMIRGRAFYAVWNAKVGLWSKNQYDIQKLIDSETRAIVKEEREKNTGETVKGVSLKSYSSGKWNEWLSFAKSLPDNYHELDEQIIFSNTEIKKEDYISKRLPYPLKEGSIDAYDELMSTLYDPDERKKLEWATGAIISGDSKRIQKFIVLYGEAGSGKSTVLNIIQDLFEGYYTTFDARDLGSKNNSFAVEVFKDNPLIAIQHDGDLSRIEDNTKINSIVSHEVMVVNEKHKAQYSMKFNSFLFMGTNKPVKITEAKSGILRRLIDVSPSGRKVIFSKYNALMEQIKFELGAIAYHCLKVYEEMGENYYDKYRPVSMMGATNDFFNFMEDNYEFFNTSEGVCESEAWAEYKKYCADANVPYPFTRMVFKTELKNYFTNFAERSKGRYKVYSGFRKEKFDYVFVSDEEKKKQEEECSKKNLTPLWDLKMECTTSIFDVIFKDCPAQYAADDGARAEGVWSKCKTKLSDLDTTKLHYVLVPENLIVIDFDLKDENGNKDPIRNLEAASRWPKTYAEYSKSGGGIHLHYIYEGDVLNLSHIVEEGIEIKVFKKIDGTRGYGSLRRKLSTCNDLPIATIASGLPLKVQKGATDVVNFEAVQSEKALRTIIIRNLRKEYHPDTTSSIHFIDKILKDAYNSGLHYDVSDMKNDILDFALKSTNQSSHCVDVVAGMKFKSDEISPGSEDYGPDAPIIFFDCEVFPNLLVICWKTHGTPRETTVKMINPSPDDVKKLFRYKLIGFNNRRYDNHIIYAASLGYSNKHIYDISQEIISRDKNNSDKSCFFGEAYNLSYADIYDYASKKQSLKKWEIELGIHHQELGIPWDQEVDPSLWEKVADYCVNDVVATEAVFDKRKADLTTRRLLADLSGLTVNDPNRLHITKILVGDEKEPNHVYTDLATGKRFSNGYISKETAKINSFPGYEMVWDDNRKPHNMYRGTDVGFGGYVYAEPGMYKNVALLDVGNMHGASIIALDKFGEHTKNYAEIRSARMAVKAQDFAKARTMLNGKLNKVIDDIERLPEGSDERLQAVDDLQGALKLILNSTYGIAAATFKNPLKDPRDKNNIIALRGALFMRTLQDEIKAKGYRVVHIKTDSVKIPDATQEIIDFVISFGRDYGYEFEHEATYEKMCLVNNAVYIAKYDDKGVRNKGGKHKGEWTATGAQFAQPYIFKTLFSKEPLEFEDVCETKETSKGMGLYLDFNESLPEGEHSYHYVGRVGQFCPIKAGCGGGVLVRELNGDYHAATGTKKEKGTFKKGEEEVYRWLESEQVKLLHKESDIDLSYYRKLADDAIDDISKFGDYEWFTSDDPVAPPVDMSFMNIPEDAVNGEVEFVA